MDQAVRECVGECGIADALMPDVEGEGLVTGVARRP